MERKRLAKANRRRAQARVMPASARAGMCFGCERPVSYFDKALVYICPECEEEHLIHEWCCPDCERKRLHDHVEIDLTKESLF